MTELTLLTALLVGLLGSVHCLGMCGGIVGVLSSSQSNRSEQKLSLQLAYNFGRIFSYGVAGYMAGLLGSGVASSFPMERVQEVGMLISGGFMIMLGLYLADWWRALGKVEQYGSHVWQKIQPLGRKLLPVDNVFKALAMGMLWGWLPCGLVYTTLVWAMFSADPVYSALILVSFGLGTLPTLILMGRALQAFNELRSRQWVRQSVGLVIILFGVLTFLGLVHPMHGPTHPGAELCIGIANSCNS